MNVKINFVGAQGTGKTMLLEAARKDEYFKDFQFCTEIVRDLVKKKNLSINESGNAKSQKVFFDAYNKILNRDGYISDRCIIDVHAYTNYLFDYKSGVLLRQHSSTPIFFAVHARSSVPLSLHNRPPHSKTTPLCKSNFRSFPPQFLFLS